MTDTRSFQHSRRHFLAGTTALGATALIGNPSISATEPPPEIEKIRLVHGPWLCYAPQYLADELLRLEGFAQVEFVTIEVNIPATLATIGDLAIIGAAGLVPVIDAGKPVSVLSGLHVGCWELFADERISTVRDLRGRRIAITAIGGIDHTFLSAILAYIGVDPRTEIDWLTTKRIAESQRLFEADKVDAFLAFPPQPQYLRAKRIGHTVVNTTLDRPWSEYFCCMVAARREFVRQYPVATKRALRAMLKAADICAQAPDQAAKYMVDHGYEERYDIALDVIKGLPYARWRYDNPEDTLRFFGLRLHEVGMIKSTPQRLISQGTDWRFLNELKRELKA